MGVLSTVVVTRLRAVEEIEKRLQRIKDLQIYGSISTDEHDAFLRSAMDEILEPHFKNCSIVSDGDPENDDEKLDSIIIEE